MVKYLSVISPEDKKSLDETEPVGEGEHLAQEQSLTEVESELVAADSRAGG